MEEGWISVSPKNVCFPSPNYLLTHIIMCTGLKDLLRELQQVIEWQHLGQLLGLPDSDLEEIHEENETTEDCRREMLLLWMEQDPNCTWKKVVDALIEMKVEVLAAQIASRYGK